MTEFVRTSPLDARAAPVATEGARARALRTWFPTPASSVVSVLLALALLFSGWHFLQWALVNGQWSGASSESCPSTGGACWAFVIARWKPWLVGTYPSAHLWRAGLAFALFAAFCAWAFSRPTGAHASRIVWSFGALPIVLALLLRGGGPLPVVPPTQWGGMLLTMVATLATVAAAFPIGLALALGRRSRLPIVRWLCAGFVEGMRSVPLLALLFVAATLLPMFFPPGWSIDLFARALLAFALFNAAMAAEVFRGGLQTVDDGQLEAAATVGLTELATLRLIVLPQAIRAVVPALVNIVISVVKETTLLSVIGVSDLLGAIENGAKSTEWIGDANILASGQVFLACVYLAVCLAISRYGHRLESRH